MTSDQKRNNNSQIQFLPTGVECNIACKYCYQNEERKVNEGITSKFNYEKILNVLNNDDRDLNLFGGEPLLAPINVIEDVLKLYKQKRNKVSMQTNLTLLNDKHIELFKKYKPHIGVSIDGWEDLNDARWIKDLETTRKYTEKTINNIKKCVDNNFSISTIITLHKVNVGTPERVRKFIEFITWLDSLKIRSSRLHLLEWDNPEFDDELKLTFEEAKYAYTEIINYLPKLKHIKFDLFKDIVRLLNGNDEDVTCTFQACDPYTTVAVQGLGPDGEFHNCSMAEKDGISGIIKADTDGMERQIALANTPQEFGGCNGCEYLIMCKGYCEGMAIDSDWRNRTVHCETLKFLFKTFEKKLMDINKIPITMLDNYKDIEDVVVSGWYNNQHISMNKAIKMVNNQKVNINEIT